MSNLAGYVYLIEAESGHFKIGKAKNVQKRLASFGGAALPYKWRLIHVIACTDASRAERKLHRLFAHRLAIGEWFRLTREDVWFLRSIRELSTPDEIGPSPVVARPKRWSGGARGWRYAHEIAEEADENVVRDDT